MLARVQSAEEEQKSRVLREMQVPHEERAVVVEHVFLERILLGAHVPHVKH